MRSGKGHYNLYIVINVLEGESGSNFMACQKMAVV